MTNSDITGIIGPGDQQITMTAKACNFDDSRLVTVIEMTCYPCIAFVCISVRPQRIASLTFDDLNN